MNSKQIAVLIIMAALAWWLLGGNVASETERPQPASYADCGNPPAPNTLARAAWLLCMSNVSVQHDQMDGGR